jgi:HEPN domain-containing protein
LRDEARHWMLQAEEDLATARANLDAERFYAVSLFSQQAAEKALKAVLIQRHGTTPPRSHDLVRLAERAGVDPDIFPELEELTGAYAVVRYPDAAPGGVPAEAIDLQAALRHLAIAEGIVAWATRHLSMES